MIGNGRLGFCRYVLHDLAHEHVRLVRFDELGHFRIAHGHGMPIAAIPAIGMIQPSWRILPTGCHACVKRVDHSRTGTIRYAKGQMHSGSIKT